MGTDDHSSSKFWALMYHPYSDLSIATFYCSCVNKIRFIMSFLLRKSSKSVWVRAPWNCLFASRPSCLRPNDILLLKSISPLPVPRSPDLSVTTIIENRTFEQFVEKWAKKWICRSDQFFHHGYRHPVSLFPWRMKIRILCFQHPCSSQDKLLKYHEDHLIRAINHMIWAIWPSLGLCHV